jgi:Tol biopolymer transport system component
MAGEIFISYRRADQAWARLLHAQLQAEGVEAWYDAQVEAGEDWRVATAQALEDSRIFVLLFSSNAALSSDIAKELAAATLEKKLIIPVRLENIAPKGAFLYELASRNWINAYENTEVKLAELAKGLAQMVRTGSRNENVLPFERTVGKETPASRRWMVLAAAAAVIAASAIAAWWLWPAPHWTVESSRPFISTLALEGEPAFSPDGKILAYSTGANTLSRKIYVRNVAGGDGIKISSDAYDDVSPSWSPDGTRIAYVARKEGEPCRIMVATVPAGGTRQAGRCASEQVTSVCWQPGTSFLYYFERVGNEGNFIFRLDLDSGSRVRLATPAANRQIITYLQCSPDGKSLLYLWGLTAGTDAIAVRDLASGMSRMLATIPNTGSASWSEDSRAVLASVTSGIGSEITAYPLDGAAPYGFYATTINVTHLAAGVGGLLALETDASRLNLARATPAPRAQPDVIDPANGRSWAPTFAPDGTLAFLSNRSGTNAVWMIKPGAAPSLLYDAGRTDLFRLEFSPDGTQLAAAIAREKGITIKILTADGGTVMSFDSPTLGFGNPTWTPDGKSVIVWDRPSLNQVRVPLDDPAKRIPLAATPPWEGFAARSNGFFGTKLATGGIWQIGKEPRLISSKYPRDFEPPITFRGDDVLLPDFNDPGGPRILAQPLAGGQDRVLAYGPGALAGIGQDSKMAVNPKTGEVIYVASVQGDTNIDLLTLARH